MKTLQQIQKENRKFILEAIGIDAHNLEFDVNWDDDPHYKPITLNRVLLAFKNKKDEIIFNIEGSQFCGLKLEKEYNNPHYSLYGIGKWNLTKETLEEQSEETQRAFNDFLHD